MSEENDSEKTEDPTPHRKQKAREEGQVPRSRELTSLSMLLAGWGLLLVGGNYLAKQLQHLLHNGLTFDRLLVSDPQHMLHHAAALLGIAFLAILPFVGGLFITALVTPSIIGGLNMSAKAIKFNLKKLNPLSGIKRLFSGQMVSEMVKSILKVLLAGIGGGLFLWLNKAKFINLIFEPLGMALADISALLIGCMLVIILSLIPMVAFDVIYQLWSNFKKLRMSLKEIKDEFKNQEGDPQIKARVRQLQRQMAQQRMMTDVPTADVVVNNPTHYSVALKYQEGAMGAPMVVASGSGLIALRIRELAEENRVPMLEAPPLARALYRHCDPGTPVPAELYSAVAEVLAWVYGLKRWRKGYGSRPLTPKDLPVPATMDFVQESRE
ncbi:MULTISPECIES: flagellar biosynthesis protein FlhB [Enterobacter]|jgi:flagellar biosynthetic protein FlhB|uniref:flagellar biosynthesis protein FlhB n=1 Tax=Enterobacter TaxID=547 RepID=UPI00079B7C30|nr:MULTISPECIES: flagellar biosynthesis protein FlhB [Enterobacter]MBA7773718.1 flagellar type III secretion system protein FlhB [Enterobacter sp. RHBSTW-00974]MBA7778881.1 flagellar type III secretion system protein FlhB [Enterobacter sp. RHBSTW-00318]MBA7831484.1 flagellar type III secretion system protein FlhB [Enterobacter sp. RHBSTW-00340]MBA8039015.1 flagellar type III secretion system protein FlhB [Enterobacter sp. RHBSTW-00131]MBG0585225.1 flagellar type III secretion system protein Fl